MHICLHSAWDCFCTAMQSLKLQQRFYDCQKPKVFNIYPLQKNTAITCCRVTENYEEVQLISQFVVGIVV